MQINLFWNKSSLSDEAGILTGAHPYKAKRMSLISSGQNSKNEPGIRHRRITYIV